jgi:hypothetical protein
MDYWDPAHPKNLSDDALLCLRALWNMREREPIDGLSFLHMVTLEMSKLKEQTTFFSLGQVSELLFQLKAAKLLIRSYQKSQVDVSRLIAPGLEETIRALLGLPPPPSGERSRTSLLANRSVR